MSALTAGVERYLHEVLGIDVPVVKPWARAGELPYFLRDAFQFGELELVGHPVILAMTRANRKHTLAEIRTWLTKVGALAGQPAVYVTDALASYERRQLIGHKVPFIVPGNQLYLPDVGLDLREHFRRRTLAAEALSPSAQAILIAALLRRPWEARWRPSDLALGLGYTPMTQSRAVKELTDAGLADLHVEGRSRWLRMEGSPEEIWERAKPVLRTPVRQTVWVAEHRALADVPGQLAGLSALAHYSMLAEPKWPVYAVAAADWKAATESGIPQLPESAPGAQEWQVWRYGPALVPDAPTVDPLSLTLSLQDNADERIQLALEEMKAQLPW